MFRCVAYSDMLSLLKFYILLICTAGALVQCMKVTFERANVTLCNEKYLTNFRVYVRRLSRKSPYYLNIVLVTEKQWGNNITCMKVTFERANVTLCNEKYLTNFRVYVRRLSRKSPYYLNIVLVTEKQWGNNITIDIVFNQFLHNEYRRSFIEMHYKFCDFINDEPYMGGMLKMVGVVCPMKAGPQSMMNMTAPTGNFPNVFPFAKGRVDVDISNTATKEPVGAFFVEASFKQ